MKSSWVFLIFSSVALLQLLHRPSLFGSFVFLYNMAFFTIYFNIETYEQLNSGNKPSVSPTVQKKDEN